MKRRTEKQQKPIIKMAEEPTLEHCPHCRGMHIAGTVDRCPLNPNRPKPR